MSEAPRREQMGFNATWSMAVGGMIGGGIFSVLGVVIAIAGQWAWLSFLLGGLIALATSLAYSRLALIFGEGGGVFTYLCKVQQDSFAGSLAWILILGYVLTISVYAFTFGHYLGYLAGLGPWFPRACALAVIGVLTWVNLRGVSEASGVEIVTVWGKLLVLLGFAAVGLYRWQPDMLTQGIESRDLTLALSGAAAVFMAYEGFQLLAYDYDDIRDAPRVMPLAMVLAVIAVMLVYVAVTLGTTMLIGAGAIVAQKEVAIAVAGKMAFGLTGLLLATIAAAFSTASAINATLFATARLMRNVAERQQLPQFLAAENRHGIPDRAILIIGGAGALLAALGSLEDLVAAASLVFLFTFATVNILAIRQPGRHRWIFVAGALGAVGGGGFLCWRLFQEEPLALGLLGAMLVFATVGRLAILRRLRA